MIGFCRIYSAGCVRPAPGVRRTRPAGFRFLQPAAGERAGSGREFSWSVSVGGVRPLNGEWNLGRQCHGTDRHHGSVIRQLHTAGLSPPPSPLPPQSRICGGFLNTGVINNKLINSCDVLSGFTFLLVSMHLSCDVPGLVCWHWLLASCRDGT